MDKSILIYGRQLGLNSSYSVKTRNAIILADVLHADRLVFNLDPILRYDYDVIVMTYFNKYTDYKTLRKLLHPKQKHFVIRTEYENISYGMRGWEPCEEICNFEGGKNFMNTNLLVSKQPNPMQIKKYDCVYYSRHRRDRMRYCTEYLQGDIMLSTHSRNHKHFYHAGCRPTTIKPLNWDPGRETLNQFRYSLYLEDEYTHNVFNNLANRWYEAGFCNNVVFFDINCWNTILKSEIAYFKDQISDYIVTSYKELQYKINYCNQDFERHLAIQKSWRISEPFLRSEMIDNLKQIILS